MVTGTCTQNLYPPHYLNATLSDLEGSCSSHEVPCFTALSGVQQDRELELRDVLTTTSGADLVFCTGRLPVEKDF